jgi:S-adenosylmethionine hydrolase
MSRPLGFLTDYGPHTEHVGALHAVAATIAPESDRIDLAHDIPAGDIRWGAIVLERLVRLMPRQSVTVAVVDPGVGTGTRPVAVELEWGRVIIGPDNGVLGRATDGLGAIRAVHVTSRDHMREPVSDTFHGRDVFVPAAAHVAEGIPLDALGPGI